MKLAVIAGPTASGKTALGVLLAKHYGGEVVSADSMQIYRSMDIGTAKPTPEEMDGVPHHMLDVADPAESWSVARYVEAASDAVDDILRRGIAGIGDVKGVGDRVTVGGHALEDIHIGITVRCDCQRIGDRFCDAVGTCRDGVGDLGILCQRRESGGRDFIHDQRG